MKDQCWFCESNSSNTLYEKKGWYCVSKYRNKNIKTTHTLMIAVPRCKRCCNLHKKSKVVCVFIALLFSIICTQIMPVSIVDFFLFGRDGRTGMTNPVFGLIFFVLTFTVTSIVFWILFRKNFGPLGQTIFKIQVSFIPLLILAMNFDRFFPELYLLILLNTYVLFACYVPIYYLSQYLLYKLCWPEIKGPTMMDRHPEVIKSFKKLVERVYTP